MKRNPTRFSLFADDPLRYEKDRDNELKTMKNLNKASQRVLHLECGTLTLFTARVNITEVMENLEKASRVVSSGLFHY